MTIEKIKGRVVRIQGMEGVELTNVEGKLNEIIDVVNSLTGGEKEEKRWRIYETPTHFWRYEESDGNYIDFKDKEKARKHALIGGSVPKSNTLREKTMDLLSDYANFNDGGVKLTNEILSLIKEHFEKEVDLIDWELQSNHKVKAVVKQIIKNL